MNRVRRVHYEPEWKAFVKNTRRFDENPKEKRYGVVNPSVDHPSSEEDMLWADCPRKLHDLHYDNWPPIALRNHVDWLERLEGKQKRQS